MFKTLKKNSMNLDYSDFEDNIPLNIKPKEKEKEKEKEKDNQKASPLPPKDEMIKMINSCDNFAYKINYLKKSILMANKLADDLFVLWNSVNNLKDANKKIEHEKRKLVEENELMKKKFKVINDVLKNLNK